MRRLLTIGHSYVVASNRRLAHEMALQGSGRWQVTAVAPARFRGDMREIAIEPIANAFVAVNVPPGVEDIQLMFRPPIRVALTWLSWATLFVMIGALGAITWRRR